MKKDDLAEPSVLTLMYGVHYLEGTLSRVIVDIVEYRVGSVDATEYRDKTYRLDPQYIGQ